MRNNVEYNVVDDLQLFIPVSLASKYSKMSMKHLVKHIQNGYIPHRGGEFPENASEEEIALLSNTIEIPLSELKSEDIKAYILDHISEDDYFKADFLGFQEKHSKKELNHLLNNIRIVKDIATIKKRDFSAPINNMAESIFSQYQLSSTRYYEEFNDLKKQSFYRGLFKKLLKTEKKDNFTSLCPLARDFIMNRLFRFNNSDTDTILADLIKEAECQGDQICLNCPHNPLCSCYETAQEELTTKYPTQTLMICELAGKGMVVPSSRATIDRFKESLSKSQLYFAQNDYKLWEARYGYKISRNLPTKVNEIHCSDHTELDILLLYGYTKDGKPILKHPWATIQIDIASGVIVGTILSFRPDSDTVGQCFARSVAVTVNNPEIFGTPLCLMTDRGKDYKSKYICENDHNYINRPIFENGLLPVLNCKVMHCSPRSPWIKPVERTNLTIKKMLRRYPGYSGGKRRHRLKFQAEKELKHLLEDDEIMTLEKFAHHWYKEIIPKFNNHSVRGKPSPMERYRSLEKEETLVPDWSTLSVFLRKKHKAKVSSCKITYKKQKYYHSLLDQYNDKEVLIYTLDENWDDSIFVVHKNHFICEAFKENKVDFVEKNKYKLAKELSYLRHQKREIEEGIETIRTLTEVAHLNHRHYATEDIVYTVGETITKKGNPISDGSLEAAKAGYVAEIRKLNNYKSNKRQAIAILSNIITKIKK